MRKRICFCVTLAGTFKAFLLEFSHYLIEKHNYDVSVICDVDDSMAALTGEHLHYIPVKMKRGSISLDSIPAIFKMYRIFRKEKFDIVQYSTRNAGTYASIAAWMAGIKCRLYCQWGMMFAALKGPKRLLLKWDEKLITSLSTVIESESFSMYEEAIKYGMYTPKKASVIWNGSACGVDIKKYQLENKKVWRDEVRAQYGISDSDFVFGYCGRITRDKGINELFSAFKELLKDRSAYLMIIGAYDNPETIDPDMLKWARENPKVIFTGRQNNVPKYYSALDVFTSLSYREGFGLVVIEAAAMGVPGIVSDALGQRDTIENGVSGLLVRTKDVQDVLRAMNYCLDHQDEIKRMGDIARRIVETNYDQAVLFEYLAAHRDTLISLS